MEASARRRRINVHRGHFKNRLINPGVIIDDHSDEIKTGWPEKNCQQQLYIGTEKDWGQTKRNYLGFCELTEFYQ